MAANIPVVDLDRAKNFYINVLGLENVDGTHGTTLSHSEGGYVQLMPKVDKIAEFTSLVFLCGDVSAAADTLIANGVVLEKNEMMPFEYDDRGVAMMKGMAMAAYFKDTEGNSLALYSMF